MVQLGSRTYTVGVLVQSNHGDRRTLVNGVPVGQILNRSVVLWPSLLTSPIRPWHRIGHHHCRYRRPSSPPPAEPVGPAGPTQVSQSLVPGVTTTAATLWCRSLRPLGAPRHGSIPTDVEPKVGMLALAYMDKMFSAVIEATAEAILNAMAAADTLDGRDGLVLHALGGDRLATILDQYGRRRFSLMLSESPARREQSSLGELATALRSSTTLPLTRHRPRTARRSPVW